MKSDNSCIFDISLESFEKMVIQASHQQPILVDLWADWCPPCVVIAPILESVISDREGEVLLAKLEVDEGDNMKIAGRYQVRGFPTILMIHRGEEIDRFSGAKPRQFIEQFIDGGLAT
ncbi:MAG: thioredoxin domain-containing protein [Gammaproteobacteria bacterium]|nr:thioredoxin domain-containing protein [Gammaproteobacteria bacterium]